MCASSIASWSCGSSICNFAYEKESSEAEAKLCDGYNQTRGITVFQKGRSEVTGWEPLRTRAKKTRRSH
jgi:hypothetical protein